MALDAAKKSDIKGHFVTREGIYKQLPTSEYCRPNRTPLSVQVTVIYLLTLHKCVVACRQHVTYSVLF